jgi:bifunctional lysine-specific demethylase and histidyl-hydroxylase NO66
MTPEHDEEASTALARCVGDVEGFLSRRFTVEPHRWHGEGFDDLLGLADVDRQLAGAGLRRPAVRLVRDGEVLDPATWTRSARTGAVRVDDLVDPARALALFADGATIVLQSLHRWWPPLTGFCGELEEALGHAVQANAYLTPPGSAGLTPHHDTHDVFVLQVHGRKHWVLREPLVEAPLARHRSDHEEAVLQPVTAEVDLGPGDCLYLPRGTIHSAAAQEGTSLHLTIGVLATTVHDLLRRLLDRAADEPALRRSLPLRYAADEQAAAEAVKEAAVALTGWLDGLDAHEVAADLVTRDRRRRPPLLEGMLEDLVGLDAVDDATRLARRPGVWCDVVPDGHRLRLELRDRTLDLPAALEGVVRRLLDGRTHGVGDLADSLDGPSRAVLARRLVREGVLRVVHGP